MARTYAGVLGLTACGTILARGLLQGSGVETTMLAAVGGLFLFALIGCVAGALADQFVRESVRTQFQSALAAWEKNNAVQPANTK